MKKLTGCSMVLTLFSAAWIAGCGASHSPVSPNNNNPTSTPILINTPIPTLSATSSFTPTNTVVSAASSTSTITMTPTRTATATPTNTITNTALFTSTHTATNTPTNTSQNTSTNTATNTATSTSTNTTINTSTNTITDTPTNTPANTATVTYTVTNTSTSTSTNTTINTSTNTTTDTPTNTPANTATDTDTPTNTSTWTTTDTTTDTSTNTPANTATVTDTPTNTSTSTPTDTTTDTPTGTATNTATSTPYGQQAAVVLNMAGDYEVLAGTSITNAGATTVCGGLAGVSGGTAITGVALMVCGGVPITPDYTDAVQAETDLTTAYNDALNRSGPATTVADLSGLTLSPGLYQTASASSLALNGIVTLAGGTDPNPVYIFQVGSALNINSGSFVFTGTATAADVFWQVGTTCTLGTSVAMVGNIMAKTSIVFDSGATLQGRALTGVTVTLIANSITAP